MTRVNTTKVRPRRLYASLGSIMLLLALSLPAFAQDSGTSPTNILEAATTNLNLLWILIAAAMVFMMQAGFKCLEVGMMRKQHGTAIGMKNVIDWTVVSLAFFLVGFGFMFGDSINGLIGGNLFLLNGLTPEEGNGLGSIFFLFQLAFAATAITIVSGAMAERTGFITYLCASVLIGLIIYPVFGHWVWGNAFYSENQPWLASIGFMDFAGGTVVHSVGAWVALVGVWILGPRLGRYDENGEMRPFKCYNVAYAILGVLILWFGWWGFNGGSTLKFDMSVGSIILNTNLAAAAGGLAAFFHSYCFQQKRDLNEKILGGVLGGLVAITPCCNIVTTGNAVLVGLLAGVVHNYAFDLIIRKLRLDDSVGAIPVHGFCGAFGTLCVGLFGQADLLAHPRLTQIGVQLVGITTCFVWCTTTSYVVFQLCKRTVGLRVSPQEESEGITLGGGAKPAVESVDAAALRDLM